jgi:arsenate reductase-like glutaredoxin family protein
LNSRNELYRERGMKENPPARAEALRLMAETPNLIKRPILVKGREIVLGFDEPEWSGLV